MKNKILENKEFLVILFLILVGIIIGIPLLSSKLNVYYDDGIQHIARAYGTYNSFKDNILFPNIISSFANNFGYSWNLFYGPLSSYGVILISLICRNFVIAYKIFVYVCLILSGYFMYKFVNAIISNKNIAILAGILYMTFPYHLTDLYTRNALGEFVSFVFIPIVFWGLYNLFYTDKKSYHLIIGAVRINFNT